MNSSVLPGQGLWRGAAVCLCAVLGFAGVANAQTTRTLVATPSEVGFGDVELGTSRQATVRLAVAGDTGGLDGFVLDEAAFGATGPFSLSNVNCSTGELPAGNRPCSLTIRFTPTRAGERVTFSRNLTYVIYRDGTQVGSGAVRVSANGRGIEADGGNDDDDDGVDDERDRCPNTPRGARVDERGCPEDSDEDDDGVGDDLDRCPNTPPGTNVDNTGCPRLPEDSDDDDDGVDDDRDRCPNTPRGARVDENGCPEDSDDDDDGVDDDRDRCPNTPRGARVDENGCPEDSDDDDDDGVDDDRDRCPNTPRDARVDENGCPEDSDDDDDGVDDDRDRCPNTPRDARVDENGCPEDSDDDDDDIDDDRDRCPNTPAGASVDQDGCARTQLDSDGDGVNDADDRCPDAAGSGADGCPTEDEAEDKLRDVLTPFTGNDPVLDRTRDVIADSCTSERASAALKQSCDELEQAATAGASGVGEALREITPEKATKGNVAVRQNNRVQNRNLGDRISALRSGARGASLRGLTASFGDYRGSVEDMAQMIADAVGPLGGGAAGEPEEDTLLTGSRWGYFLSGELSKGDKDETAQTSGFDFENRVITTGIDYRLRDNLVLGAAVSFLDGENDIDRDGGSLDSGGHSFSLYGTWYRESIFFDFSVSRGAMEYEQTRRILYQLGTGVSVDNRFDAKYDGESVGAFAGLGWNAIQKQWNINFRATLDYLDSDLDAFSETARSSAGNGAGWAVSLDKQNQTWLTGTATATASYVLTPRWGVVIPFVEVDLIHEFENDRQMLTGRFVGDLQGESLTVRTDDPDTNYIRVRAGASMQLPGGFAAFADYGRLFVFDNWNEYTISAGIRYEF